MSTPGNSLNITSSGLVKFDGTATFSGVTTTNHDVLVGAASNGITNVAPSSTSGVPLVSNGASADPSFTTAVVSGGGTGITTATAYGLIAAGTTSTGNFQVVAPDASTTKVLVSGGTGALPTWNASSGVGVWVEIQTQTASNSASITFTSNVSSYNTLVLLVSNVESSSGTVQLQMQTSTNGGSSYLTTGYVAGCNTWAYNNTGAGNTNSTAHFVMFANFSTVAGETLGGFYYITDVTSGADIKMCCSAAQYNATNSFMILSTGANTNTGTNALKISMSANNISTGKFTLYGVLE